MLSPLRKTSLQASRAIFSHSRTTYVAPRALKFSTSNISQTEASRGHNPETAASKSQSTVNAAFDSSKPKNNAGTGPQSSKDQGDVNKEASPSKNTLPEPEGGKPADRSASMASNPGNSDDGKEFSNSQDEVDRDAKPSRNK